MTQRAGQVILSWSYPALTTAGRSLTGIDRISIYRYVEELPTSAFERNAGAAEESVATEPQAVTLFSRVPTLPKAQFEKLAQRVESIDEANLAAVTAGDRLLFTDAPPFASTDGRPVRLTYGVVTEAPDTRSEYSNLAIIIPLPVATAPAGVSARADASGVVLEWQEPSTSVQRDQTPVIAGYHIYRTAPGVAPNHLTAPINTAPLKGTTYTDTPSYGEHEYRVTAVAASGPPLIQSDPSAPVVVTFRDLVPPPPPTGVTPLVESNAIRLIWEPVEATDLAGYKIYRMEGAGHVNIREVGEIPVVIQPIAETTYLHSPVSLGIAFRYAVTAVDKSGNESARAWSTWVVAPKTP